MYRKILKKIIASMKKCCKFAPRYKPIKSTTMKDYKNTIAGMKVETKYYATVQYPEHWVECRENPYWVLVRTKDEAILCSPQDFNDIIHYCWYNGIKPTDLTLL